MVVEHIADEEVAELVTKIFAETMQPTVVVALIFEQIEDFVVVVAAIESNSVAVDHQRKTVQRRY